jgi:hypothetical protein
MTSAALNNWQTIYDQRQKAQQQQAAPPPAPPPSAAPPVATGPDPGAVGKPISANVPGGQTPQPQQGAGISFPGAQTMHDWMTSAENQAGGPIAAALAKGQDYLTGGDNLVTLRQQAKQAQEGLGPVGQATAGMAGQFLNPFSRIPGGPIAQGAATNAAQSLAAGDDLSEVARKAGWGAATGGLVASVPALPNAVAHGIQWGGPLGVTALLGHHLGGESGVVGGLMSRKVFDPAADWVRSKAALGSGPGWDEARQALYNLAIGGSTPLVQQPAGAQGLPQSIPDPRQFIAGGS